MTIDDPGQHVDEIGVGLDAVEFAVLDQRGDVGPVVAPAVGTCEQRILAIEPLKMCAKASRLAVLSSGDPGSVTATNDLPAFSAPEAAFTRAK